MEFIADWWLCFLIASVFFFFVLVSLERKRLSKMHWTLREMDSGPSIQLVLLYWALFITALICLGLFVASVSFPFFR